MCNGQVSFQRHWGSSVGRRNFSDVLGVAAAVFCGMRGSQPSTPRRHRERCGYSLYKRPCAGDWAGLRRCAWCDFLLLLTHTHGRVRFQRSDTVLQVRWSHDSLLIPRYVPCWSLSSLLQTLPPFSAPSSRVPSLLPSSTLGPVHHAVHK
jgi:hypothetical protein